ncbi:MAG: glycosyl transferase family 1, partial [Bacteroidetes bacterium HGW-Bacteroidetes-22]
MKILLICNKSPYPPLEGGPIAMNMMIEGLLEAGHQVKVLAINTNKYFTDIESIPEEYRLKTNIELHYTNLRLNPLVAIYCLIMRKSFHAYRFNSSSWLKPLEGILSNEQFDIVQIETLFMAPALDVIKKKSRAKVILRAHNVEHLIWKR